MVLVNHPTKEPMIHTIHNLTLCKRCGDAADVIESNHLPPPGTVLTAYCDRCLAIKNGDGP